VEKRIAQATNAMEQLHCTKESIFPFSSYVTGLNACYAALEQADDTVNERNEDGKMLKGITAVNPSLIAAMQHTRSNQTTKNNFAAASSELGEQIALLFPGEARRPGANLGRRIAAAGTGNRNEGRGRGGGRGRGRG
jgi:hypothetical protein